MHWFRTTSSLLPFSLISYGFESNVRTSDISIHVPTSMFILEIFIPQRIYLTHMVGRSWEKVNLVDLFSFNSLRPRPNRHHFADDIFKCIFENENEWISPGISLKFVPKVRINNIPALVQIMDWRRSGNKPLSEPMMVSLPTHICVTRPQWINSAEYGPCCLLSENVAHQLAHLSFLYPHNFVGVYYFHSSVCSPVRLSIHL